MIREVIVERETLLNPRIPCSTYRLQFNASFKFTDAKKIIPYLYNLGISDIYASPYFKAEKGSLHGYDIVDPNILNPEVGTEEEYNEFVDELTQHGMGQILDIVPNHMCITSKDNLWWMDVLENGPSSLYAYIFDIDWKPVKMELKNKVLIPVLGDQYGRVLEKGELRLTLEEGVFFVNYFEYKFPLMPKSYILILRHRMNLLRNAVAPDDPYFAELLSIVTALQHLPEYTVKDNERISERRREKEIIKKCLHNLYNESRSIRDFLNKNVQIFNGNPGEPKSFDLLDNLLSRQVYRLSHWMVATEEINYRRFFGIYSLGAIRMEDPRVFQETQELIFKLIKDGKVTGLRIDHLDGLYNPSEYFHRLQRFCFLQTRLGYVNKLKEDVTLPYSQTDVKSEILKRYDEMLSSDPQSKAFYIVGEKILTKSEKMPEEWPIYSTTGYVFFNSLNGIFVDMKNEKVFENIYSRFIKQKIAYQDIVYEKKRLIMEVAMSSEVNTLGHYLNLLSEKNRHTRDFTLNSLTNALTEVIAFFPVYRTYINSWEVKERDRQYIELAVSRAKKRNPAISSTIFDFIKEVLLLRFPDHFVDNDKNQWLDFVMRFQQITGSVMAKGVEDTAFYVYNRLISLNEVGGNPEKFGTSLETFHGQNIERIKFWPHALIATSTHDSKRSEDVRARINVLSEIPEKWKDSLIRWSRLNKGKKIIVDGKRAPDLNEEYFLYQTLIGTWPVATTDAAEHDVYKKRIKDHMLKAAREAKINTSWINPNTFYEDALVVFIETIMSNMPDNEFLKDFIPFQRRISLYGMYNSLSQVLLKIASPGIPDFYNGSELWDFSLVDPDNRRPVDYTVRQTILNELNIIRSEKGPSELANKLIGEKENGKIKLYTTYTALNFRRNHEELFKKGKYIPLEVLGERENHVCAFARQLEGSIVIVVIPRFLTHLIPEPESLPFGKEVWGDTYLATPSGETGLKYRNIFTDGVLTTIDQKTMIGLYIADVFSNFPAALLERID